MIRFQMPKSILSQEERKDLLDRQFEDFLRSEVLAELLSVIEADFDSLSEIYGGRKKKTGGIMETQDMDPMPRLEDKRNRLYSLFRELGAIDINKPLGQDHSRILIYGGAIGTCFDRTGYGSKFLTPDTISVDALTCYRPINPVERKKSGSRSMADTEFGALTEAFEQVYGIDSSDWQDRFHGDRNLNSISCIREKDKYRLFAAPSSEPELRRADTGDCLCYYLEQTSPDEKDSLLAITSNRYCNRQFVQTAYQLISMGCRSDFDVIGCHDDEHIHGVEDYDPLQYIQDLIGTLDWIDRFRRLSIAT